MPDSADMLTLRDRAAQLVFARLGSNMPPPVTVDEDADRMAALLDDCALGGLVLFNARWPGVRETLAGLQRHSRLPLIVGSDIERGTGQQVRGATVLPHAMAFSALGEAAEAAVEAAARMTAREALACGIHLTFAPVADVNRNARNPIIATRAFGETPEVVSRLVRAYVRGCQAEGLLTTAKHFPGHGGTSGDSHEALPTVDDDRAAVLRYDVAPFEAAIAAGVDAIMTAHVAVPALDPQGRAATLSPPILQDLLRKQLGFQGVVVTDSLLMGAVRATHATAGDQAVALLQAGVDVILDPPDPRAVVDGIVQAVEEGRLPETRLGASVERVQAWRRHLTARYGAEVFTHPPELVVGGPAHHEQARDLARRAVSVLDTQPGALPVEPAQADETLVVLLKPFRTRLDPDEEPLGAAVRARLPGARYVQVEPETPSDELAALLREAAGYRHVVAAPIAKPAAWHRFGLPADQQTFLAQLCRQQPTVVASLGSPYILDAFREAAARLCTYSDVAASQAALVDRLITASA